LRDENREERDYSQVYELYLLKACKLKTGEKDVRGKAASNFFPRTSLPIKPWSYRLKNSSEKSRPKEASSTEKLLLRRSAGNKSLNHFYPGNFPSRRECTFKIEKQKCARTEVCYSRTSLVGNLIGTICD